MESNQQAKQSLFLKIHRAEKQRQVLGSIRQSFAHRVPQKSWLLASAGPMALLISAVQPRRLSNASSDPS